MWQVQVKAFLADYEGVTLRRYRDALAAFSAWYVHAHQTEPDAALLVDDEVRDYRSHLTGVKGYKAATVSST